MKRIVLLIFLIGFVSAVDVDFDCPDEIYADEEFECSIEVSDGDGVYDLKVDLNGERNSGLEIWTGDAWKSGYYYLIGFIEDEENVKLRISEAGKYDSVLKLRQDGSVKSFNIEIRVEEGREDEVEEEIKESIDVFSEKDDVIALGDVEPVVISLNSDVGGDEEWDYVSKDGRIVDLLVYGFCLFLICLIGILLWDRF